METNSLIGSTVWALGISCKRLCRDRRSLEVRFCLVGRWGQRQSSRKVGELCLRLRGLLDSAGPVGSLGCGEEMWGQGWVRHGMLGSSSCSTPAEQPGKPLPASRTSFVWEHGLGKGVLAFSGEMCLICRRWNYEFAQKQAVWTHSLGSSFCIPTRQFSQAVRSSERTQILTAQHWQHRLEQLYEPASARHQWGLRGSVVLALSCALSISPVPSSTAGSCKAPSLLQLPEIRAQDGRTCSHPPRWASFLQYVHHNRGRSQIALDSCSPAPLLFLLEKGLKAHELSMASLITACGLTTSLRPSGLRWNNSPQTKTTWKYCLCSLVQKHSKSPKSP